MIKGTIVTGFKRGSKFLGIPTANIEYSDIIGCSLLDLIPGAYYGVFKFKTNKNNYDLINLDIPYKAVLSIGYNPYFENNIKTIEVFLIEYDGLDFYGEEVELEITNFIRCESNFDNFKDLVTAITYDIITANNKIYK